MQADKHLKCNRIHWLLHVTSRLPVSSQQKLHPDANSSLSALHTDTHRQTQAQGNRSYAPTLHVDSTDPVAADSLRLLMLRCASWSCTEVRCGAQVSQPFRCLNGLITHLTGSSTESLALAHYHYAWRTLQSALFLRGTRTGKCLTRALPLMSFGASRPAQVSRTWHPPATRTSLA